ncbi:hypothetical protein RV10_GL002985 [Enterococcus pallens]|nr:hypothetical protein RV10_GL002985 [Enterococcus pallens]
MVEFCKWANISIHCSVDILSDFYGVSGIFKVVFRKVRICIHIRHTDIWTNCIFYPTNKKRIENEKIGFNYLDDNCLIQ